MGKLIDEYFQQRADMAANGIVARTVLFSPHGFMRAMSEDGANSCHFSPLLKLPSTYGGLPYVIDQNLSSEFVVTHESVDLMSQRLQASQRARQNAITFAMKGSFGKFNKEPPTMIKLVAQSLDTPTLCNIIMAWLEQDLHWGDFEKELSEVVKKHGRFEN